MDSVGQEKPRDSVMTRRTTPPSTVEQPASSQTAASSGAYINGGILSRSTLGNVRGRGSNDPPDDPGNSEDKGPGNDRSPDGDSSKKVDNEANAPYTREAPKVGRNDVCPCGSGKKYKHCHGKLS